MRRLRRIKTRWPLSVICITALVWPMFASVLISTPAAAQFDTKSIAVVDFRNGSKVSDEMFATLGTDAVVVELVRSGKFDVASSDALQSTIEKVGYSTQGDRREKILLTPPMLRRIGEELQVEDVVGGEIVSIEVDNKKNVAKVRLAVRMLDVASGEWVNGVVATGTSHPRIGYTGDKNTELIVEAINDAARKCVETMVHYIIPEATVLGAVGTNEVLLNKGAQDGIKAGMPMVVLRLGSKGKDEVVGRVRVRTLSSSDARASVEESGRGIRPEDRVRAVYELPSDYSQGGDIADSRTNGSKKNQKARNTLFGVLLLAGLWSLMGNGGEKAEDTPGAIAVAGANPEVPSSFGGDGGIMILWNRPRHLFTANIRQYHVWRDNHGNYFSEGNETLNAGPVLSPDSTTASPVSGILGSFDHFSVDDGVTREGDYVFPSEDHLSLESGSYTMSGITRGHTHSFWLSTVYRRSKNTADGTLVETYWETTPTFAGRATFVSRPVPGAPGSIVGGDYADLTDITFEWGGSQGANQYVIEVSPDLMFPRDRTWTSGPIMQPTNADMMPIMRRFSGTTALSRSSELGSLPGGTVLYWRVGARNSLDTPGPYPAGPSPLLSGAKNTRYIYSAPDSIFCFVTPGDTPEPPPGGGDNGGGSGGDDGSTPPGPPPGF